MDPNQETTEDIAAKMLIGGIARSSMTMVLGCALASCRRSAPPFGVLARLPAPAAHQEPRQSSDPLARERRWRSNCVISSPYWPSNHRLMTTAGPPSVYDPFALSEEEKARFKGALRDGFGDCPHPDYLDEQALPDDINSGLLAHPVFYNKLWEEDFWDRCPESFFGGFFERCPVSFHHPAIRSYFLEQKAAYLANAKLDMDLQQITPEESNQLDYYLYRRALDEPYSKLWYEFHINHTDEIVDALTSETDWIAGSTPKLNLHMRTLIGTAGTLGRLVEQYYWKFIFEKKAISGAKLSEAGRDGAARSAKKHKAEHARWQAVADLIWKEDPSKLKTTVASSVKKRLKLRQTVTQIVRVLNAPKSVRKQP
jgi:hypothetical protein